MTSLLPALGCVSVLCSLHPAVAFHSGDPPLTLRPSASLGSHCSTAYFSSLLPAHSQLLLVLLPFSFQVSVNGLLLSRTARGSSSTCALGYLWTPFTALCSSPTPAPWTLCTPSVAPVGELAVPKLSSIPSPPPSLCVRLCLLSRGAPRLTIHIGTHTRNPTAHRFPHCTCRQPPSPLLFLWCLAVAFCSLRGCALASVYLGFQPPLCLTPDPNHFCL